MSEHRDEEQKGQAKAACDSYWTALTEEAEVTSIEDIPLLGTVTKDREVVLQRDALEKAHLAELGAFAPHMKVLDLGGGAGRMAFWLCDKVSEIWVVEPCDALRQLGEKLAKKAGISNIRFVNEGIETFECDEQFDRVLIMGVLNQLPEDRVLALESRLHRLLKPGGRLILKEPVSTDDETRWDRRSEEDRGGYEVCFRPRLYYTKIYRSRFNLLKREPTCAHLFPFFIKGTNGAVEASKKGIGSLLLEQLGPWMVKRDKELRAIEMWMRDSKLACLLAPVEVVQDFYVFEPQIERDAHHPSLSVVMIAYNEIDCLRGVTEELEGALSGIDYEIVIVDDGSGDGTGALADELAEGERVRAIHQKNQGIGGALRTGFDAAIGDYVTWVPADGQIAPESVLQLYRRRHEAPMLTTVYTDRADAWYRKVISQSLNCLIKLKTGQTAKSGGNYLFERGAWTQYGPHDDETMMLSTAFRQALRAAGVKIVEVEIAARARVAGHSKVLNWKAISRTFLGLLKMGK